MAKSPLPPRAASFAAILHLFDQFPESWLRHRVWGTMQTLVTIFALVDPALRTSYESACKTTFAWADKRFGWKNVPDPAGFQRARILVKEEDCLKLLSHAKSLAQTKLQRVKRLICGLLPIAFDGTILHMPRSDELRGVFGIPTDKHGLESCHYPQALLVSAWDLVRRIPLAWALGPYTGSERSVMLALLNQLPLNALLILDRGYPSDDVFGQILDSGRHFVVRMVASKGACWKEVADFLASGKRDAIMLVEVGKGESKRIVKLRMVLRTFDRGRPEKHQKRQTMVIITSLINNDLPARDLCRLYGKRWGIETIYRELKAVAIVEQWHGRSLTLIRQELILLLVWFCFSAIFAGAANDSRKGSINGESLWRANTRRVFEAIHSVFDALIALGSRTVENAEEILRRADASIRALYNWLSKRRPGRSYPRIPLHPYARIIT